MPLAQTNQRARVLKKQASAKLKVQELREAFQFFDRNGNGCIEADELGAVMRSLGYKATEKEVRDMINEADLDGNSCIDFYEFVRLMENRSNFGKGHKEEELKEVFKVRALTYNRLYKLIKKEL